MAEEEDIAPAFVVDDTGRLRVLDPETNSQSRLVAQSCSVFQSKLQHFQNLVKQLLDQASEKAQQIEDAKLSAVGMRNMVSAEIETRPEKLREQASLIADKQERLEGVDPKSLELVISDEVQQRWVDSEAPIRHDRLNAEYESLLMVKQEQEVLIAHLSDSSLQV